MVQILEEHSKEAHSFTRNNLLLGFFSCALFWTYPIIAGQRDLPYGIYFPGVDNRSSPFYEITYTCQIVFTLCGCCIYMPFSCLITSFIKLGIALIKILQHKLNTIANNSSVNEDGQLNHNVIGEKFVHCIELHMRIISYMDRINNLVATVNLIELLAFGILLCALLFLCNIVTQVPQQLMALSYVVLIMVQLFIPYWNANEVLVQSLFIGESLYDAPWYLFNTRNRRMGLMLIRRSQQPLRIMIGDFTPITLQMFQKVLNLSYTYFTVLRRIYK